MKKNIVIVLLAVLSSCSAKLMTPTDVDATRLSPKYPGITLADLKKGKMLYETKCTQCHSAKKPSSQTGEDWQKIVPGMANEAKKKGKTEIPADEQDLILKYLAAAGTK